MKIKFITLFLVTFFFNCKIESNKSISNKFSNSNIEKKKDSLSSRTFADYLKEQPIKEFPYTIGGDFLLGENKDFESGFRENLFALIARSQEDKRLIKFLPDEALPNLDSITNSTLFYLKDYYRFITKKMNICKTSFLDRLSPVNSKYEVFLIKSVVCNSDNFEMGIVLSLIFFDLNNNQVVNHYYVRVSGMAETENDPIYFEGFRIDENYDVFIKSSFTVESEKIEILKKLSIDKKINITERVNCKIINYENAKKFTNNFSKQKIHTSKINQE